MHYCTSTHYKGLGEFTNRISDMRNEIGEKGVKDAGFSCVGSRSHGNIIAGDENALAYDRMQKENLWIYMAQGVRDPWWVLP